MPRRRKSWVFDACRVPDAFAGAEVQQIAPQVLGFVDEKDAAVHPAMWDMLLSFGRAYPEAWAAINVRKVVLPRLMALLRYDCCAARTGCQQAQGFSTTAMPLSMLCSKTSLYHDIADSVNLQ